MFDIAKADLSEEDIRDMIDALMAVVYEITPDRLNRNGFAYYTKITGGALDMCLAAIQKVA